MDASYTLETIGSAIVVGIVTLICLAAIGLAIWALRKPYRREWEDVLVPTGILGLITLVIVIPIYWWAMYPWKAEYHEWRPVSGIVADVNKRLVSSGEKMEEKYVVTLQGHEIPYGVLDTRGGTIKKGNTLDLTCVRRWQWSGTHGYDCNFVGTE